MNLGEIMLTAVMNIINSTVSPTPTQELKLNATAVKIPHGIALISVHTRITAGARLDGLYSFIVSPLRIIVGGDAPGAPHYSIIYPSIETYLHHYF